MAVRPPKSGVHYEGFYNSLGGASDSFTAAVAYNEDGTVVLDCLITIKAPFKPYAPVVNITTTLKPYNIYKTTADRDTAQWLFAAFARHNVTLTTQQQKNLAAVVLIAVHEASR